MKNWYVVRKPDGTEFLINMGAALYATKDKDGIKVHFDAGHYIGYSGDQADQIGWDDLKAFLGVEWKAPENLHSPATRRRLATARKAMQVRIMDEPKSLEDVDARMEEIADGIRALQSLDDLGEEMNAAAARDEAELSLRYDALRKIREKMAEWKKR